MTLTWNHELAPSWDEPKRRIIGSAPPGIFDVRFAKLAADASLPGDWWRVDRDGVPIGYAWLDAVWGDAEITLAVAEDARRAGAGTFALERLEKEARKRGLNRLYNTVRSTHPDHDATTAWFTARGFVASGDGSLTCSVPA